MNREPGFWKRSAKRFRSRRPAWASFCCLLVTFLLALGAEFVANGRPLIVRYEGHWYFPVVESVPASRFGEMVQAEPPWRELQEKGTFAVDGAFILFPAIPWSPYEQDTGLGDSPPTAPDGRHWLGTDDRGRDLFARLLYGYRNSMLFALVTAVFTLIIAFLFGALQAFFGGTIDFVGQRVSELWTALPVLYVILYLLSLFPPSLTLLALVWIAFQWVGVAAYVRAETLRIVRLDYIAATKVAALPLHSVILRHVLPNALVPLVTFAPFLVASGIGSLAALDYLGLGLPAPTASWGELLRQGKENLSCWWLALYPSASLFGTLLLWNFVGEGVRSALDAREILKQPA